MLLCLKSTPTRVNSWSLYIHPPNEPACAPVCVHNTHNADHTALPSPSQSFRAGVHTSNHHKSKIDRRSPPKATRRQSVRHRSTSRTRYTEAEREREREVACGTSLSNVLLRAEIFLSRAHSHESDYSTVGVEQVLREKRKHVMRFRCEREEASGQLGFGSTRQTSRCRFPRDFWLSHRPIN